MNPDTTGFEDGFAMDVEDIQDELAENTDTSEVDEMEEASEVEESSPIIEEMIDYSYNHKTTPIPKASVEAIGKALGYTPEEVVTVLQKGANYDTLTSRQQPYEALIEQIRGYATDNGMELPQAVQKMQDALNVVSAGRYVNEIRQAYPNAPQQMIQELAVMRAREASRQNAVTRQQTTEREAKQREEQMWTSFFANHPEAKPETLSPRMLQALENQEDPERVYMAERYAALEKELNELKQTSSNASRSTGSARKTSGATPKDEFLDAFFSND